MDKLWTEGFVHGSAERIYVNTSLGCRAQCSYCYLPEIGYSTGQMPEKRAKSGQIVESLLKSREYRAGKDGTIISIGCFSECWDDLNKHETVEMLEAMLKQGNPIQLATKRYIDYHELIRIRPYIQWEGQLSVYISSASISNWSIHEKGTVAPAKRFQSLLIQSELDIPCYLYIKPVLKDITVLDVDTYAGVMAKYKVGAIVGGLFSTQESDKEAPIVPGKLFYSHRSDEAVIREALSAHGKVYDYSTDPINARRGKFAM